MTTHRVSFPGVVYFLTFWYPRHMLQLRIGIFFGAATIVGFSNISAGLIVLCTQNVGLRPVPSPGCSRMESASWRELKALKAGHGFL